MMEPAQSLVNAAHDKNQRALAQCMKSIESQPEAEQMSAQPPPLTTLSSFQAAILSSLLISSLSSPLLCA